MRYLSGMLLLILGLSAFVSPASAQEPITIGFTQYDLQSVGSTGRRIAVNSAGDLHFVWMCADPYPNSRHVYYNYYGPNGILWPGLGRALGYTNGDGFCQVAASDNNLVAIVCHRATTGSESLFCAVAGDPIYGLYGYFYPPNQYGGLQFMWPYITYDRTDRIHIITASTAEGYKPFAYTRSNDAGTTWTALAIVDTISTLSPIIVSSNVSDKVAIIYTRPTDSSGVRNDVYYVESIDGISWNGFNPKHNITDYGHGDNRWAWTEVSALYDCNDNLHIIWNAQYVPVPPNPPMPTVAGAHLYHFDASSGTIHAFAEAPETWPPSGCDFGQGNFIFAKFSIAADRANNLYVAYTSWSPTDCSAGGYANGDIYLQFSTDNGVAWSNPINLTNSQSPDCAPVDCESDNWSSLAEVADTSIHLFYVNDRDAGGIPYTEGAVTDNPMLYLSYSDGLPLTNIKDDISKPRVFALSQNYPNPFNARTIIKYSLKEKSGITLSIYNIVGQKVATLFEGKQDAGEHQVVWDANDVSSGIYFAKLETGETNRSIRMTLLR